MAHVWSWEWQWVKADNKRDKASGNMKGHSDPLLTTSEPVEYEREILSIFVNVVILYIFVLKLHSILETMPSTLTWKTAIFFYLICYYSTPLKQTFDNCHLKHLKPKFNHEYLSGYSCLLPITWSKKYTAWKRGVMIGPIPSSIYLIFATLTLSLYFLEFIT